MRKSRDEKNYFAGILFFLGWSLFFIFMPVFGKTRLFNYLWFYIVSYFLGAGWVFLTFKSARLYAFANKGFLRVVMPMFICAAVAWFLYRDIGVAYSVAISCMLGIGTGTTLVGKPPTKNNG